MINSIQKTKFKDLSHIKGVIFDLDGTLTKPIMNFKKLREDLGITEKGVDVLQIIKTWTPEKQVAAHKIIYDFEREAALKLEVQIGAKELIETIDRLNLKKAIHSRNSLENIQGFQEIFGYSFTPIVGREVEPPKPHPAGCHHIASHWRNEIQSSEIIFVGDSADDMKCSQSFGSLGILLLNHSNAHCAEYADIVIESLTELKDMLELKSINTTQ